MGQAELSVNQKARVLGFCTDRMTGREIAVDPLRFWLNVLVILFGGLLGLLILKVLTGASSTRSPFRHIFHSMMPHACIRLRLMLPHCADV